MKLLDIGCLVAIGSNQEWLIHNPVNILTHAIDRLMGVGVNVTSISRFYKTPAFPSGSGPDYANAALLIRTNLPPNALLQRFHDIEQQLGRIRINRWGQRTVDIDLLSYGDQIIPNPQTFDHWINLSSDDQKQLAPTELIVPHPRIQDRAFVLGPLMDIAPDWVHPVLGQSVRELYNKLLHQDKAQLEIL